MRFLAFYLPQFHPVPENDTWWGRGFTEWTNVAAARPLFRGHAQPDLPGELGFYDLRLPEVRAAQAELAAGHGIDGFCYYHYWFGGRQLLERPFAEVLRRGEPDFPFALCWANENWTRAWNGGTTDVLVAQAYSAEDDLAHIRHLAAAFADSRYVRVGERPVFLVYRAAALPDPRRTADAWRAEADRLGVGVPYLCAVEPLGGATPADLGFDAAVAFAPNFRDLQVPVSPAARAARRYLRPRSPYRLHRITSYEAVARHALAQPEPSYLRFPCVTPGFDNSPRRAGGGAVVLTGATPDGYARWLAEAVARFLPPSPGEDLVFVNAWNEWAEGNHLEPSQRWGRAFLEAHARVARAPAPARPPGRVAT